MTIISRALSMAAVGLPLALATAGGAPPVDPLAAALRTPQFTVEQRVALARARQAHAHPLWRNLSTAAQAERLVMFGRRMVIAATAGTPAPVASAGFEGNLTLVKGPSGHAIELQRQADCSLSSSVGTYTLSLTAPAIQITSTTAQYQNVLHAAAGLETRAGVFAHGCAEATLGIGSRRGFYLGRTSQNLHLFASQGYDSMAGSNALYYGTVDASTSKVHSFATDVSLPFIDNIVAGDLDGNGLADVVGLDLRSGSVSVWLAHADGSLGAPHVYVTGWTRARAAVLADFDGDGKADLVVATTATVGSRTQESIAFLRGRGDGTFDAARTLDVTTPAFGFQALLVNLVAVDLRGSGRPDIVGSNGLVLFNDGHGAFTQSAFGFPPPSSTTTWGPTLAAGDFNEDGKQDVAVSNGASVTIQLGRGDGSFDTGRSYALNDSVGYLTATDLDGDGHADLYVGLANGGFFGGDQFGVNEGYAIMGHGDGSFAGAPVVPFVSTGHNLADLDGDGTLDGVGLGSDLSFTTWLGDGHGAFAAHATLPTASLRFGTETFSIGEVDSFDVADIDGDGKPDLVFLSRNLVARNSTADFLTAGFVLARGDGRGGWATPSFVPVPAFQPDGDFDTNLRVSNVRLADLNGDGKADLVYNFASSSYRTHVRSIGTAVQLSHGDGTFGSPQVVPFYSRLDDNTGFDLTSQVQHFVDLNHDGHLDLLLVTQTSTIDSTLSGLRSNVQVALGRGDGTFATPVTVSGPEIVVSGSQPTPIAAADMNGDGIVDLVVLGSSTGYDAQLAIALGNGDGTFKAPSRTTFAAQALSGSQQIAVADFNGDGKPDVLVANPFGATGIAFGAGDGTLAPLGAAGAATFNLTINVPIGGPARVIELNGDGKPDVLVGDTLLLSVGTSAAAAADFAVSASSTAATVSAGQSVATALTLSPGAGYAGDVSLSCSGLPVGASCTFAPPTASVRGGAASTSTLTISTAAAAMGAVGRSGIDPSLPGGALLSGLLVVIWLRRRDGSALLGRASLALLLVGGGLAVGACGGGSGDGGDSGNGSTLPGGGTPPGSYAIGVVASDGALSHTVTFVLQVN